MSDIQLTRESIIAMEQCPDCYGDGGITVENFGDVFSFECPTCHGKGKVTTLREDG